MLTICGLNPGEQHSLMSAILNGGRARAISSRQSAAALIDVSDTEWRVDAVAHTGNILVAALIDVSDTEWRVDIVEEVELILGQHSLMSAILNGGTARPMIPPSSRAALIDVSDTEWRI